VFEVLNWVRVRGQFSLCLASCRPSWKRGVWSLHYRFWLAELKASSFGGYLVNLNRQKARTWLDCQDMSKDGRSQNAKGTYLSGKMHLMLSSWLKLDRFLVQTEKLSFYW